jgi:hypothetical protein
MKNLEEFWLINSTFKRVSNVIKAHNFKLQRLSTGDYAFYLNSDSKLWKYDWAWANKKELLLGNNNDNVYSLFYLICCRKNYYDTIITKPKDFFSENELKFIDICQCLKDCSCLEELVIKMDLIGI